MVPFEMTDLTPHSQLQDKAALRWSRLEDEDAACVVVSDRMELVYINAAAMELVSGSWFGKRCFEVLPGVEEACAFHCPKIRAVSSRVARPDRIGLQYFDGPIRRNAHRRGQHR